MTIKRILAPFASMKLTVVLMALAMILVYAGTTAQIDSSIWQVQKQYFHGFLTWINFHTLLPYRSPSPDAHSFGIPFPGGYTLGVLMLLNLIAAHATRFKWQLRHIGTWLIHFGLILLLLGELLTSQFTVESRMVLSEGESKNFSEDTRTVELAVAGDGTDVVFPAESLRGKDTLHHSRLPFEIHVDALNTASETEFPTANVTLTAAGQSFESCLLSPGLESPPAVAMNGKSYQLQLRYTRYHHPFTIQLLKFSHDRYTGTEVARNFASRIRLIDPVRHEDREVSIWMNHPLRHAGLSFYQASFLPGDKTSILQVVKNPAWFFPYAACIIGGLGLTIHFTLALIAFLSSDKRLPSSPLAPARPTRGTFAFPLVVTLTCLVGLLYPVFPGHSASPFNLDAFGALPVSFDGRTQPLDSLARNALRVISGRQTFKADNQSQPAIRWLLDLWAKPEMAEDHKIIRIDQPDIISLLKLDPNQKLFGFHALRPSGEKLEEQITRAEQVEAKNRDLYQRRIAELGDKLRLYTRMGQWQDLLLAPPLDAKSDWQTVEQAVDESRQTRRINPGIDHLVAILHSWNQNDPEKFNQQVIDYHALLQKQLPQSIRKTSFESTFNRIDPFYTCMILYVLAFVLVACSWLGWTGPLARAALCVLIVALVLHTFGLAGRIYISGRPPVTNLASSAAFIAWGAVLLTVLFELVFRNGAGSAVGSMVGFIALLIYYNLSADGDTMKVLVAVLDTNIWLATHVVAITLGYMATFVAGFLAILYVLRGVFTRSLSQRQSSDLARMIYGSICFAVLFSFVGTILGGIWADQSWGRFWGWDPKENGAALIVLWNAIILHARWDKLVRERGLAILAIGGNIITSWSWFGTNMMGVGLHSYGFMDAALFWLLLLILSQLLLIALGLLPLALWRSPIANSTSSPTPEQLHHVPS